MPKNGFLRRIVTDTFEAEPTMIVRLLNGTLMGFVYHQDDTTRAIAARFSEDSGETWSRPRIQFALDDLPTGIGGVAEAVVDHDGEVHLFLLHQWTPGETGDGERGEVGTYHGRRIDIWHTRSGRRRTRWQTPKCIWKGYTGALNSVIQLSSGRIILPFSYATPRSWHDRGTGLDAFTFMGMFKSVAIYSDDGGDTWALSNDIKIVTPDITYAYGACEPVALELNDGRVWMLIRTQMGRLYESFSTDGRSWSRPRPSRFFSSDSPAGIVRLNDGRIVLFWNNCLRYPYAYGGRQVLHAAISDDDGRTWRGYREVARDPLRNSPPPAQGDHGTAYPFPVVTADNVILIRTGQGENRVLLMRVDPEYLYETVQEADFKRGLEDWSIFGTMGVELIPHPDDAAVQALRIRKIDKEFPAAAVWNFPMGPKGSLRLRFLIEDGNQGFNIGLTDHFSVPFDYEDVLHNVFDLVVGADGDIKGGIRLKHGIWHEVNFGWDCDRHRCETVIDGKMTTVLRLRRETEGVSYLRVHASADDPEVGGLIIGSVEANVSKSWPHATS